MPAPIFLQTGEGTADGGTATIASSGVGGDPLLTSNVSGSGTRIWSSEWSSRGTRSIKFVAGSGSTVNIGEGVSSNSSTAGSRGGVRAKYTAVTYDGGTTSIDGLARMCAVGGARMFSVGWRSDGRWYVLDAGNNVRYTSATGEVIPLNKEIEILARVASLGSGTTSADGVIQVQINNITDGTTVSTSPVISNAVIGNVACGEWRGGKNTTSGALTGYWDDIRFDPTTGGAFLPAIGAHTPPVVSVPATTRGTVGTVVSVTGSATVDGAVSTQNWTLTGPDGAVTPSGATTGTMSWTPTKGGVYTYLYTVTDNSGEAGNDTGIASGLLYVTTTDARPRVTVGTTTWTPYGTGIADLIAGLRDSGATTGDEGPSNPSSAVAQRLRLDPMDTAAAKRLEIDHQLSGTGARTLTIRLLNGATEVGAWTVSPAPGTSTVTWSHTLTSGELAALDCDNIDVELIEA